MSPTGAIELRIEESIRLRRFDLALPAIAELRESLQAARADQGDPAARQALLDAASNLRRLIRLAQAERARMGAELEKLTASVPYLAPAGPSSTWRVEA